jgi:hypothetical protein
VPHGNRIVLLTCGYGAALAPVGPVDLDDLHLFAGRVASQAERF